MSAPYINIHTHSRIGENTLGLRNLWVKELSNDQIAEESLFSAGIHPWFIKNSEHALNDISILEKFLPEKKIAALGEAGLDKICATDFDLQKQVFEWQIQLAEKYRKPMIIHCVKAYDEVLHLKKKHAASGVWIVHGFNSSMQMAEQLIEAGCRLSFGEILFKKDSKAAGFFYKLPAASVFLETDESEFGIMQVYEKAAELCSASTADLREQMYTNFRFVFDK